MKNTLLIICVLIIVAGAFYITNIPEPEPEIYVETVFDAVAETTYLPSKPETIRVPGKVVWDTLYIWDTVYATEVAEMDTAFKEGELFVQYFYKPQLFNLEWEPYPVPTVTKTITETIHLPYRPSWYETRTFGFITGCLMTGTLVWMVK